jgi:hypothetical protein
LGGGQASLKFLYPPATKPESSILNLSIKLFSSNGIQICGGSAVNLFNFFYSELTDVHNFQDSP